MSFLFKSSGQPQQQSTPQAFAPQFSAEQKPFLQEIFGQAKTQYEAEKERGYTPFPGPQLAPFTPEEQQSFEMYRQIAGGPGAQPFYLGATQAALGSAQDILGPEIQARMSPYQQAVTDVAMREAARQFQTGPLQQIRTGATAEGGLRGARRAIAESEGMRQLERQLSDIQTLGSQQAYQQALAEAAAQRGRLAGLAGVLPGLGTGLTTVQQQQAALLGGVGELQRQQQQQAIDLARQEFAREEMYPVEALSRYLGFISGAPQPGGSIAQTQTVQGPSALAQFAGLVGGLGTLAGGLGGDKGFASFFKSATGGRVGGLSSLVRRQAGGRVVRMADGGPPPFDPYNRAIDQGPPSKSFFDIISELGVAKGIQSIADTGGIFGERAKALSGNAPLKTTGKPQEMRGVIADYGTEFQPRTPYDEAALPAVSEAEVDSTPVEGATTGELTAPAVTSSPEAKATYFDSPLQERFAAYLKLTSPDTEEKPMTWSQRLQLAGALMAAGSTPSTGSFLGDLAAFGGAAGLSAGKVLSEKEKSEREAALRKGQLYRDFLSYEAGLRGEAREQQKLDILRRGEDIKTRKYISELREIAVPKTLQIEQAQGFLQEAYPDQFVASKMKKGEYGTTGTDVDLATIAATLKTDIPSAFAVAQAAGAVMRDQDGNLTIDTRRAIDAAVLGRASSTRPTAKAARSESGNLVVPRAEGGRLALRYPEDF